MTDIFQQLSLHGDATNQGSGDNIYVTVNVTGSVMAENNLADSVANAIYRKRSRGGLTV